MACARSFCIPGALNPVLLLLLLLDLLYLLDLPLLDFDLHQAVGQDHNLVIIGLHIQYTTIYLAYQELYR